MSFRLKTRRGIVRRKRKLFRKKKKVVKPTQQKMTSRGVVGIFPNTIVQKMKVCVPFVLTSGAGGALASVAFVANSAYDPFVTGAANTQPLYYDQISALYQRYQVLNSKLKFTFSNTSAVANTSPIVSLHLKDSLGALAAPRMQLEDKRSSYVRLDDNQSGNSVYTRGSLTRTYSDKSWWKQDSTDRSALINADPALNGRVYYLLSISDTAALTQCTVTGIVEMEMLVLFHEPIDPGLS